MQHLGQLTLISLIRYTVIAGIPFILFYKIYTARFVHLKIQSPKALTKDFLREIGHSLQTTIVLSIIGVLILYTPLKKYTLIYDGFSGWPVWWIPLSLVLSLVLHDTYFYWMHRLLHDKRIFRRAHLVHHQSTNPSPWTSYSFHFLEAWAEGGVLLVLAFVLPMNLLTIALFVIAGFIINVYGHLGYELMPQRFRHTFWFEFLNTSVYHNMHHRKFRGNYGLYFRIWDRLMKTEHPDYVKEYDRIQEQRFGHRESNLVRE